MNQSDSLTLTQEPAQEKVIKQLYSQGFINAQGRIFALEWLSPHQSWGYWITTLCALVGCTLVLAGMICFFAYNWQKMSTFYQFTVLETALVCTLFGAWAYSLDKLGGKLFITSASMLVGIFLAVFGQIYQTGADAYQLFVTWSLLITPWVLISHFAPLWLIWLVLLNLSCILYWQQMISPASFDQLIFTFLIILNATFLVMREYCQHKNICWLQANWQRIILLIFLLLVSFIPIEIFIQQQTINNLPLTISMALGMLGQISLFIFYRYYQFDRWALTLILISYCSLLLSILWRLAEKFSSDALQLLFMAISTIIVFTMGATILKKLSSISQINRRLGHENH